MSELYNYLVKDLDGNDYSFEQLKGKVVLIVNTASKCGFTPQYEGLQKLYEKYGEQGLMIIGFPSNDFLFQEPGSGSDIKNFCMLNYGVDFPMMEKVHVNGSKAHPVYKYLTGGAGNSDLKGSVKWNFSKFLFDRQGNAVERFSPATKPEDFEENIKKLL